MTTFVCKTAGAALRRAVGSPFECNLHRRFSSDVHPHRKVTVLGAAGGIGQPLSMLMKLNPLVSKLALYDIASTPGVAADVSHINTQSEVVGYTGEEELQQALEGTDVVIIPAGVPRKPGMTRDDLFKINAGIVKSLCVAISKYCPQALVNVISNPVNSTVPIAAEVFKKENTYDERKLFGVTTLDVVRAKTFFAEKAKIPVAEVNLPVIGGHAGITILPLFSQATPKVNLTESDIKALTKRTQDGGTEVVEAKAGKGSATLSMAYAGALFADACLKGLNGAPDVVKCSFVASTITDLPYFASKIKMEVETQGDFIRYLIKEVEKAEFTEMSDVVHFMEWLDDELSFLVDERAVLKHFEWPEQKADALREAAFGYADVKKLESEVMSFFDDPRQACGVALKKMQMIFDKLEHSVYNLSRMRESTANHYRLFRIPVEWMQETGSASQIKMASVKLAMKFMRRVSGELETGSCFSEEEDLILQAVRFAFRVHQFAGGFDVETMRAFQELKEKAKVSSHNHNQTQHRYSSK